MLLTGLNHFNPKAYGLPSLCLRLTAPLPDNSPRLDTGCGGSPLPGRDFHPQVQQRLVAHKLLIPIIGHLGLSQGMLVA